jgi:hypothetical protein
MARWKRKQRIVANEGAAVRSRNRAKLPAVRSSRPAKAARERRLAAPGLADDRQRLSRIEVERHIVQRVELIRRRKTSRCRC